MTHIAHTRGGWLGLSILVVGLAVAGCREGSHDPPPVPLPKTSVAPPPSWTVMVYMAADNNLDDDALADLNEMEQIGSSANLNILVQIDTDDAPVGGSTTVKRLRIEADADPTQVTSPVLEDRGELDSADPGVLADFVAWARLQAPSDHTLLVLWDHGLSFAGFASDDTSGSEMSYTELEAAFQAIRAQTGISRLDIVGLDASLMGSLSLDALLSEYALFRVASEELEPGSGWAYQDWLGALAANPYLTHADLAGTIARTAVDAWVAAGQANVTCSAVDLRRIPHLLAAVNSFAQALRSEVPTATFSQLLPARRASIDLFASSGSLTGGVPGIAGCDAFADLASFAEAVRLHPPLTPSADSVLAAISQAVTANHSGPLQACPQGRSPGGIGIHFPSACPPAPSFADTELARSTLWDEFLVDFSAQVATDTTPPQVTLQSLSSTMVSPQAPVDITFDIAAQGPGGGDDLYEGVLRLAVAQAPGAFLFFGSAPLGVTQSSTGQSYTWNARSTGLFDGVNPTGVPLALREAKPGCSLLIAPVEVESALGVTFDVELRAERVAGGYRILGFYTTGDLAAQLPILPGDQLRGVYEVYDLGVSPPQMTGVSRSPGAITVTSPLTLDVSEAPVAPGAAELVVWAEDNAGNVALDRRTVTVN